jgi:hypothetical protein
MKDVTRILGHVMKAKNEVFVIYMEFAPSVFQLGICRHNVVGL